MHLGLAVVPILPFVVQCSHPDTNFSDRRSASPASRHLPRHTHTSLTMEHIAWAVGHLRILGSAEGRRTRDPGRSRHKPLRVSLGLGLGDDLSNLWAMVSNTWSSRSGRAGNFGSWNSRRPPIPQTAGFGCDMPFAIPGPARNTKSTTKFISPRLARGSAVSGGGSSAQPKTGGCASSICRPARADFDHDPLSACTILRSRRGCGGHVRPITRQAHCSKSHSHPG
jgi:hypothetical protein